ncbi:MAG TPA: hypothetical protein VFY83_17160 [Anaerolineales bacterium]|nr:hypothetical protein [Anaerolineales bacterium]
MSFEKAQLLASLLDHHAPHQRPGFSGRPPVATGKARRNSAHPLDSLYRRHAIDKDSYIAGLRFRTDYEIAQYDGDGTTNWDRFDLYQSDLVDKINELGFKRPSPKPVRNPPSSIPVSRFDAKETLGKLRIVTGAFGFQLMRCVCVCGINLQHVSVAIKVHRDYLSLRFREALAEAALFYKEAIDSREDM